MTPTPDAKGAQPEQLVEEARERASFLRGRAFPLSADTLDALATTLSECMTKESGLALIEDANRWQRAYNKSQDALSECREALVRVLEWPLPQGTVEDYALPPWLSKQARDALAAQPPSEASERSGNKEERARRADERESEGSAGHLPPSDLPRTPSPEQPEHEEARARRFMELAERAREIARRLP